VLAKLPRYPHRVAIVGFDVIGVTTEVKRGDLGRWSLPPVDGQTSIGR
jgi:hypothetical protein